MIYNEESNMGLPTTFNLVNGRFELIGGKEKVQDNMRMVMAFVGWFRYYYSDFCVNLFWLLQKPASYIELFKMVYLTQFIDCTRKYAPFLRITKTNLNYSSADRKTVSIGIEYVYVLDPKDNLQFVQFIEQ